MGVQAETETHIEWEGPEGIVLLSKDDYEVKGGTIRLKRRPAALRPVESDLPLGVVRGT